VREKNPEKIPKDSGFLCQSRFGIITFGNIMFGLITWRQGDVSIPLISPFIFCVFIIIIHYTPFW